VYVFTKVSWICVGPQQLNLSDESNQKERCIWFRKKREVLRFEVIRRSVLRCLVSRFNLSPEGLGV
jgi:hypothetical protein